LAGFRGGLLGGAVGDALGASIEFQSPSEICAQHGEAGITDYVSVYGRHRTITDDTQMTFFIAVGLLRAWVR
jgi:ADP-ribosylglycohydrolase